MVDGQRPAARPRGNRRGRGDGETGACRSWRPSGLGLEGGEHDAALGDPRIGIDGQHARSAASGPAVAGLADRLSGGAPGAGRRRRRTGRGRRRAGDRGARPSGGSASAGAGSSARRWPRARPMRVASASGSREDDALAPGAALDQGGVEDGDAHRAPAALTTGQEAVESSSARPSWAPEADSSSSRASSNRSPATRGTSGVSRPWARSCACRPTGPKRSATAPRGSAASALRVAKSPGARAARAGAPWARSGAGGRRAPGPGRARPRRSRHAARAPARLPPSRSAARGSRADAAGRRSAARVARTTPSSDPPSRRSSRASKQGDPRPPALHLRHRRPPAG